MSGQEPGIVGNQLSSKRGELAKEEIEIIYSSIGRIRNSFYSEKVQSVLSDLRSCEELRGNARPSSIEKDLAFLLGLEGELKSFDDETKKPGITQPELKKIAEKVLKLERNLNETLLRQGEVYSSCIKKTLSERRKKQQTKGKKQQTGYCSTFFARRNPAPTYHSKG